MHFSKSSSFNIDIGKSISTTPEIEIISNIVSYWNTESCAMNADAVFSSHCNDTSRGDTLSNAIRKVWVRFYDFLK